MITHMGPETHTGQFFLRMFKYQCSGTIWEKCDVTHCSQARPVQSYARFPSFRWRSSVAVSPFPLAVAAAVAYLFAVYGCNGTEFSYVFFTKQRNFTTAKRQLKKATEWWKPGIKVLCHSLMASMATWTTLLYCTTASLLYFYFSKPF